MTNRTTKKVAQADRFRFISALLRTFLEFRRSYITLSDRKLTGILDVRAKRVEQAFRCTVAGHPLHSVLRTSVTLQPE
jgi:hypothetical protein